LKIKSREARGKNPSMDKSPKVAPFRVPSFPNESKAEFQHIKIFASLFAT